MRKVNPNLEFSRQNTSGVDVARVGLDALVVAQDLSCRGCWHWSQEKRVSDAMFGDLGLQGRPIVKVGRGYVPHVVLKI